MRIECYDISTIQGTNTVGSMVVFEEGRPRSGEYRRFRIKTVEGTDDYASHREVLRGGSIARSRQRRGSPRSCAGGCPTSWSSTAAWARSTPRAACWISWACTTCR